MFVFLSIDRPAKWRLDASLSIVATLAPEFRFVQTHEWLGRKAVFIRFPKGGAAKQFRQGRWFKLDFRFVAGTRGVCKSSHEEAEGWESMLRSILGAIALYFGFVQIVTAQTVFSETGGVVVIEAENYSNNLSRVITGTNFQWVATNSVAGYSGTGYMEALPNVGANINLAWSNTCPKTTISPRLTLRRHRHCRCICPARRSPVTIQDRFEARHRLYSPNNAAFVLVDDCDASPTLFPSE
jgi:hypothetical protein